MWTREGYWQYGKLLTHPYGRVIHDPQEKLVLVRPKNSAQAAQEGARRDMEKMIWAMIPDFLTGTRHKASA